MVSHDALKDEEAHSAAWEAGKGGFIGAVKWGAAFVVLGAAGYAWSPVYRATTIQFKVYIQMSGMVMGGMIEADSRLRQFEYQMRMQRRYLRDKAKWDRYEEEFAAAAAKNEK